MKNHFRKSFLIWLPFAALVTFACGISCLLVQQDMRMGANDPQVQIVGDIVTALSQGVPVQEILPQGQQPVDMRASLDPYLIIFSASGTPIGSSATLDGQVPAVPSGTFAYAMAHGEDRFTWQPAPGVRVAAVLDYVSANANASSSFVLAGRSLTEVESQENKIADLALFSWIIGLIVMFGIIWAIGSIKKD